MDVRMVICGLGRVGQAFMGLLIQKEKDLQKRYGLNLKATAAVDIGGAAISPEGLPLEDLLSHLKKGGQVENMARYGKKGFSGKEALSSGLADLLVEATPTNIKDGEPGMTHIRTAFSNGLHVVTAAKGPLVLRYSELKASAEKAKVRLMISAATAAALPTLDVGLSCLAGTEVLAAEGILNGTTNYILTRMYEDGCPYGEALAEAQKMGVAEPDPSLDVEGRDTANKILLIANEVFQAGLFLRDISVEGITRVTPEDIERAKKERKVIKLIGKVEKKNGKIVASVSPMALPLDHPLACVRGTEKAISYLTDTMDRVTVSGGKSNPQGAAAAILKDIIQIYKG
ncbi:MAG: homoserine dehydrogenase [Deltaproteobacteria bacterium]|nr:homoserine dehydrogenase [Deltaproteobacteria bacterium]